MYFYMCVVRLLCFKEKVLKKGHGGYATEVQHRRRVRVRRKAQLVVLNQRIGPFLNVPSTAALS